MLRRECLEPRHPSISPTNCNLAMDAVLGLNHISHCERPKGSFGNIISKKRQPRPHPLIFQYIRRRLGGRNLGTSHPLGPIYNVTIDKCRNVLCSSKSAIIIGTVAAAELPSIYPSIHPAPVSLQHHVISL